MTEPAVETFDDVARRIEAAASANGGDAVIPSHLDRTKARVVAHIEERLAAYDLYSADQKKVRSKEFAQDIVDAAIALLEGMRS